MTRRRGFVLEGYSSLPDSLKAVCPFQNEPGRQDVRAKHGRVEIEDMRQRVGCAAQDDVDADAKHAGDLETGMLASTRRSISSRRGQSGSLMYVHSRPPVQELKCGHSSPLDQPRMDNLLKAQISCVIAMKQLVKLSRISSCDDPHTQALLR